MRFTPSASWSYVEGAPSKSLQWRVFARPIGHLSGSLSSGSWTEVTDYLFSMPAVDARIEYEVGEFTTNEIAVEGSDLAFWRDSVLTTGSAYTEMKATLDISDGTKTTTDSPTIFSGFVSRDTIAHNELADRTRFNVASAQDVASRIAGEYLTTRYIFGDIKDDDTNISGSVFQFIPGAFLRSANPPPNAITNGTFCRFTGSADDDSDDLVDFWNSTTAGGRVEITSDGYSENGLKLYRTVASQSGALGVDQAVDVTGSTAYELNFMGRADLNSQTAKFSIYDETSGSWIVSGSTAEVWQEWRGFSYVFTTNPGTTRVRVYLNHYGYTNYAHYFDDVSLLPRDPVAYSSSLAPTVGVHRLSYSWTNGIPALSLDGGRYVSVSTGTTILGNGATEFDDSARVHIYMRGTAGTGSMFPKSDGIEEEIVVLRQGENLPYQWFRNCSGRSLVTKLYNVMGITGSAITFGGLGLTSPSGAKLTYIGNPPETGSTAGPKSAIETDGTNLFIAVGSQIWKRTTADDSYTYLADVGAGMEIGRLIYNARNNHLWVVYGPEWTPGSNPGSRAGRVRLYNITNATLSSEVVLWIVADGETELAGDFSPNSVEVLDVEYSPGNYWYRLVATTEGGTINGEGGILSVDANMTRTDHGLFGFTYDEILSDFAYRNKDNDFVFSAVTESFYRAHVAVGVDATGSFIKKGVIVSDQYGGGFDWYSNAVFVRGEGRVYYIKSGESTIRSHTTSSISSTTIGTLPTGSVFDLQVVGTSSALASVQSTGSVLHYWEDGYRLYSVATNSMSLLGSGSAIAGKATTAIGSAWFGLDQDGRLLTYGTSSTPFVPTAKFGGSTIRDALNDFLRAYVLVSTIYGKTARVYQRTTASGTFNSTGATASITTAEGSDIDHLTTPKFDLVSVSNEKESTTYDGTSFGVSVLSDRRRIDLSSPLIHRTLIRDVALHAWGFFGRAHSLYRVPMQAFPAVEYEPLDAVSLSLASTKIGVSGATGVLVATTVDADGTTTFEVMT